ncbi:MAG TPA: hypothetical protein VK498_15005 [Ferruginibacter sp.]|nr:hypothetical protein [Ferruginibacter sp.]
MKRLQQGFVLVIIASLFLLDAAVFPKVLYKIYKQSREKCFTNKPHRVPGHKMMIRNGKYFIYQYLKPNELCVKII